MLVRHGADLWARDEIGACPLDLLPSDAERMLLATEAQRLQNWGRRKDVVCFLFGSGLLQRMPSATNPFAPMPLCTRPSASSAVSAVVHNPDLLMHFTKFL